MYGNNCNILKHAEATCAAVTLKTYDGKLIVYMTTAHLLILPKNQMASDCKTFTAG
jgi:hypothetical protein